MLFLPQRMAARLVVPVPENGSSTVSPTKLNILTSGSTSSAGYGAGWERVEAPRTVTTCFDHFLCDFSPITLSTRIASVGRRYAPGLRCIKINSMSFFMMEFGSYGFPRNEEQFSTSNTAFEILCHTTVARLWNPM